MTTTALRIMCATAMFALIAIPTLVIAPSDARSASRVAADPADLRTPAGAAVADLTGAHPMDALGALGRDQRTALGYDPVIIDGSPANPHGGCSSPIPLPARFEPFCRIHDLGYDLLRLAARTGRPLRPWARTLLDRKLNDAMHRSCTDPICTVAADLADIGVRVNTWRQRGGEPVGHENAGSIALSAIVRATQTAIS